jgi:tetratricopeptide (TPR) repeat protein
MPEAKKALERAIQESNAFADSDVRRAQTYSCEGMMFMNQTDPGPAAPLFEKALNIWNVVPSLDPELRNTICTLNNLAEAYKMEGKFDAAVPLCQRALAIIERVSGTQNPTFHLALDDLAVLYDLQGKYEKAEPLYNRCLSYFESGDATMMPRVLEQYAHLLRHTNRQAVAEKLEARARSLRKQVRTDG